MKKDKVINRLDIENSPTLLKEYGRAFAWINMVEMLLFSAIATKKYCTPKDVKKNLDPNSMLDQKIYLLSSDGLLKKDGILTGLITDLNNLNEYRKILAHGIIYKQEAQKPTFNIRFRDKKGEHWARPFNQRMLKQITKNAKIISKKLYNYIDSLIE